MAPSFLSIASITSDIIALPANNERRIGMRALVKGLGWMALGLFGVVGGVCAYVTAGNVYYEMEIKGSNMSKAIDKVFDKADKGWEAM